MIGTDSHTPNAGGLGMVAIGVGGADAVDVMTGFPFNVRWPKVIGVHLTGALSAAGRRPKDVILEVAECSPSRAAPARSSSTSARAPTRSRPPARPRSATWAPRSAPPRRCSPTTHNMAAVPQGDRPRGDRRRRRRGRRRPAARRRGRPTRALRPGHRDRPRRARAADQRPPLPRPGPPRRARSARAAARERLAARDLARRSIGSCTNSSYEDITRAASIARQASAKGLQAKTELLVTPGSEQVRATIERDGLLADLEAIGAHGAGQRLRAVHRPVGRAPTSTPARPTRSSTATTATSRSATTARPTRWLRHVARHGDRARARRHARLRPDAPTRSPTTDGDRGAASSRRSARCCPTRGFDPGEDTFIAAARRRLAASRSWSSPTSDRLQLLEPFPPWDGNDYVDLPVLMKAKGKCTTDHISAAGPWLKYRGHLENISRQPVPRRRQRVHRRDRRGQGPARRRDPAVPRHRQALRRGRRRCGARSATRTTARARRASTRRWSPGSATAW